MTYDSADDARKSYAVAIETIGQQVAVARSPNPLALPGEVSRTALTLPDKLSEPEWRSVGERLVNVESSTLWWLGDWWAFGDRKAWGERKAFAEKLQEAGGVSFDTCMGAAWVSRKIETCRRRQILPWSYHREVAALRPNLQDQALDWAEKKWPNCAQKELRAYVRELKRPRIPQPTLPDGKYAAIYADPPWRFEAWSGEGTERAAENHYPTMTQEEIEQLPVSNISGDDCVLFLWAVMPQLQEALNVIEAWGFKYKTCAFNWVKFTKDGERFATGMGYWTRANAELCLLATKGSPKRLHADVQQAIASPRMEHSRKPDEVAERIERLVAGPYIELFARRPRKGWKAWGNQV